ncbi:Lamin Tail Domain [Flavobacteriaceae bacterium MAR_2010_188]|nr:Lamin Tail Domain [Flavobacteriaceae bacterium MAR_2010_188]
MDNRFSLTLLAFIFSAMSSFGQGSESFTNLNASGSTYQSSSFIGDNGLVWNYQEARSITLDFNIVGKSIGLSQGLNTTSKVSVNSGSKGVGRVSYKIRSYFTGGMAADRKIEIYVNGILFDSYTLAGMNTIFERSFTTNVPGNVLIEFKSIGSKQISLDDISWTEYTPTPTITIDKTSISDFNYGEGYGPSSNKSFSISGKELVGDITLTSPAAFEISLNETSGFTEGLSMSPVDGIVSSTPIYVRLKAGLTYGTYNGNLSASSNAAATKTVVLNGSVYIPPANVVLTEIMYDTSGPDDEWIEICNISGTTQNLSLHKIVVGGINLFTFPLNSVILNGQCITVALGDNLSPPFNADCSFVPDYGTPSTTNNLPNSTKTIEIVASYSSTIVDSVTYSTGNGGDGNGASLHVINAYQGNSMTSFNWMEVPNGGSPGINSLISPCSYPEIQLKNSSGNLQACGNFTINFDRQALGYSTDRSFEIKNEGTIALDISSLVTTGDFSIVSPNFPLSLAPGYTQIISLRFIPTSLGAQTSELSIISNDEDEGNCKILLKGIGYTPIPEIDVERNTMASISSSSPANTGNNTLFASTTIGTTTSPKTYYIRNEGTANLNVSSLISSNPVEFRILPNSAPILLAPNESMMFEIDFTPNGKGTRTATITIANDDSDENPYIIYVKGTGVCAAANLNFLPSTGPIGTIVTVTGSNYGAATTASLNGINTSITVISNTKIEVTIPVGATTGNIIINDNNGCESSKRFTVIDLKATSCEGDNGLRPKDLFISEVTDKGTGSHSYIEIYNGTGASINLAPYKVAIHNNGNPVATSTISLSGTIANKGVVVVAVGGTNRYDPEGGYTAQFFSSSFGISDDDHIRLTKSGVWVDLWGEISGDPFTIASKDYTYRRKGNGVYAPSTTWNNSDWTALNPVDYTDIGKHDFSIGIPPIIETNPSGPSSDCEIVDTIFVEGQEGFAGGQPITYKWFYNAPGEAGWTEISLNDPNFTGQGTAELNIVDLGSMNGYQFFSQIQESSEYCYGSSTAIRMKVNKTKWNGWSWSDGAPHFGSTAIIEGDYNTSINGNLSACKLSILNGAVLTITNQNYVEVINNITVNSSDAIKPSTINVKTAGNFIQINNLALVNVLGTGKITVEKETSPMDKWYEYTYWSSPVRNETIDNALSLAGSSRRFYFNAANYLDSLAETNNNNQYVEGQDGVDDNGNDWMFAGGMIMQPGVGYASTNSPASFSASSGAQTFLYEFSGAFNNGIINVPIYRNDNELRDTNWNLIGNPYPSPISVDKFIEENTSLDGAIYIWSQGTEPSFTNNGNELLNFSQDDYAIINGSGETAGGDGIKPNRFIPSGQGFFVSYSNEGAVLDYNEGIKTGKVVFANSMRTKGIADNNQFFRTRNNTEHNKLWLNLTSEEGLFSQMLIAYVEGATDDFDGSYYDAPKNLAIKSFGTIYSIIEDDDAKYVIQGKAASSLVNDESVDIGYSLAMDTNSIFEISIPEYQGNLLEELDIILQDTHRLIEHDLKNGPYRFTSDKGEINDRFKIIFKEAKLKIENVNESFSKLKVIELKDGQLQFTNESHKIESIVISDLSGRTIYQLKGNSTSETYNLPRLLPSAYIAKVRLSNGESVIKKIIKKI